MLLKMKGMCGWVGQDLCNFTERCYAVMVNTVQQLSCLYRAKDKPYKTTFKSVKLLPIYR